MTPKFEILTMAPENTNSVLMTLGTDAVIFDAWGRADAWDELLRTRGLTLRAIYTTHGHPDHMSAAPELAARHRVPWYLNPADRNLMEWGNGLLEYFGLPAIDPTTETVDLPCGEFELLPGVWTDVIACPGHSAGGVAFYFRDAGIMIIGDTLFPNGVGRWDLPGGDEQTLRATIARLGDMNLPDETFVIPGHGFGCTWGEIRHTNPYLRTGHGCGCGGAHGDTCQCGGTHADGDCCHGNETCK